MMVLATDASPDASGLRRLAARSFGGLTRPGAAVMHRSGDDALAFPTAQTGQDVAMSDLFGAALEGTEEAILNTIPMATPMSGYGTETVQPSNFEVLSLAPR